MTPKHNFLQPCFQAVPEKGKNREKIQGLHSTYEVLKRIVNFGEQDEYLGLHSTYEVLKLTTHSGAEWPLRSLHSTYEVLKLLRSGPFI